MTRTGRRALALAALVLAMVLGTSIAASGHPLGNFTVNQFSGLVLAPDELRLDYVVDHAEIPTFQLRPKIDRDGDGQLAAAELSAYAGATCGRLRSGLRAAVGDRPVSLRLQSARATLPPGQAGLPTLRLSCRYAAPLQLGGLARIRYDNANFADRVGWREITAVGDGTTLVSSNVPAASRSARLTAYPQGVAAPLDLRSANLDLRLGGPRLAADPAAGVGGLLPRGVDRMTSAFLRLVGEVQLGFGLGLLAVLLALGLGGLHALAPGHGKTVMAAYLVARQGSLRTALPIAVTVTITHTAGVLVLGVALTLSTALAPERLLPVLGTLSGLLLAGIGVGLLHSALRRPAARHQHGSGHWHHHEPEQRQPPPARRSLVAMGFAGGLVPSPSALVVLLGAIALNRAWFGVALVLAYGAGMAATLTLAGLLLVRARSLLERRASRTLPRLLTRAIPVGTAGLITVIGLTLAARGAATVAG